MRQTAVLSDSDWLKRSVSDLTTRTGMPVAFGGFERSGAIEVAAISGARTSSLEGLVVQRQKGLGGRALVEKRPRLAIDYRTSRHITHDYDRAVLGEGISTLFAVPVMVSGRARGVLYCGAWDRVSLGDAAARAAFSVASELAAEIRVTEEVARRVATTASAHTSAIGGAVREELRESFAELRRIATDVSDDAIRARLRSIEQRLAALTRDPDDSAPASAVHLSPREIDVLACASLGATNAEIATTLALKEVTVKSYMQSAMSKLDASTRHAAVALARRAGILP